MADKAFTADFAPRLPGRVKAGSRAAFRKSSTKDARAAMANIIVQYEDLIKRLGSVTPTALRNAMLPVFRRSQVYVPKKTGDLMDSGRLDVYPTPSGAEAYITYGNDKVFYAAMVHEFVWLNHEPPTRAKYLQSAMEEELDAFLTSLAVDYAMELG